MSSTSINIEETPINASKRSSWKLRPSVLSSPAHIMTSNTNTSPSSPWSPCEMPWAMQSNSGGVVEFRGHANNPLLCKRKADNDTLYTKPKKVFIEEKMAEHLNGLHISHNFTSHSTPTLDDYSNESMESDSTMSSTDYTAFSIPSAQDLEQKLRNAQRITICEQIRKLQNEPLIPQAILSRFERPCTALVLWQPPQKISDLCVSLSQQQERKRNDEEQDNNNSSSIDLNNSMELDM